MLRHPSSAAFLGGAREALGAPIAVLSASYFGFGALASAGGVPMWAVMVSTVTIWALPGQLVMMDMWLIGAPMIAVLLAATLTNARFLPMTMTLMPVLRDRVHSGGRYFLAAHLVATISWTVCMRCCPDIPRADRAAFFSGFTLTCMAGSAVAAAVGYLVGDAIAENIQIGLVFMTTVYFFVILIGEARSTLTALALACGALAGPLFHLMSPQWSVLAAGLVGGTAAFLLHGVLERHRG